MAGRFTARRVNAPDVPVVEDAAPSALEGVAWTVFPEAAAPAPVEPSLPTQQSADNPLLTDRSSLHRRRRLRRVILDTKLRLPLKARIVATADDDLLVFTSASLKSPKARKLQNIGVELVHLKPREGKMDLNAVLRELGRREILSVLLEAGPRLNAAALAEGIVNKMVLFYAPKFAGQTKAPFAPLRSASVPQIRLRSFQQFGADLAAEFILHH